MRLNVCVLVLMATCCGCSVGDEDLFGDARPRDTEPRIECFDDDDCQNLALCTGHEVCIQNVCFPGPGLNLTDHLQCTDDKCDLATGLISHPFVNIDDKNPCTVDGCTEGLSIWHVPLSSETCAADCRGYPDDTGIAGKPCAVDADCPTHGECLTAHCDKYLSVCALRWADEGSACEFGGVCDSSQRCCSPL